MDLHKALYVAKQEMDKAGLVGWGVGYNNTYTRLGQCSYSQRTIYLSKPHTFKGSEARVLNTIRHEIAHAFCPGHHHDEVWYRKAVELGCTGDRCTSVVGELVPQKRYNVICPTCQKYHRQVQKMITIRASCGSCSGGKYNSLHQLRVVPNPKYAEEVYEMQK